MGKMAFALASVVLATSAAPAFAGASNFMLVNGTGAAIAEVSIRRAGTNDWKPLGASSGQIQFSDPDCAFDIRANLAGAGPVTWSGINLCDVKAVHLKHDSSAGAWVDYD